MPTSFPPAPTGDHPPRPAPPRSGPCPAPAPARPGPAPLRPGPPRPLPGPRPAPAPARPPPARPRPGLGPAPAPARPPPARPRPGPGFRHSALLPQLLGRDSNDGPWLLFVAAWQRQRWDMDAVITASMGHRCCTSDWANDNDGPWVRFRWSEFLVGSLRMVREGPGPRPIPPGYPGIPGIRRSPPSRPPRQGHFTPVKTMAKCPRLPSKTHETRLTPTETHPWAMGEFPWE